MDTLRLTQEQVDAMVKAAVDSAVNVQAAAQNNPIIKHISNTTHMFSYFDMIFLVITVGLFLFVKNNYSSYLDLLKANYGQHIEKFDTKETLGSAIKIAYWVNLTGVIAYNSLFCFQAYNFSINKALGFKIAFGLLLVIINAIAMYNLSGLYEKLDEKKKKWEEGDGKDIVKKHREQYNSPSS